MNSVGAFHAKTHLAELLNQVEQGEKITITRHGNPVAILIPATPIDEKQKAKKLIDELHTLRRGKDKGKHVKNASLKDLIDAGRKYK